MSQTQYLFSADYLNAVTRTLFTAVGTPSHIAEDVARIMVKSNLTGHDSHGVLRIPKYLGEIEEGKLDPAAEPTIVKEKSNLLIIDGHHGFGHYTARQAMLWAIEKAKQTDICAVSFRNLGHMGRMGEYVELAAEAGCISLLCAGHAGGPDCTVVPYGGRRGALLPNPMTVGVPTGEGTPFVLDMATSALAEGNLQVARSQNSTLPEGTIVNREGAPSSDVADFYDGGYLLPFGGHKGYGLALWMTLLGGLSGRFYIDDGFMAGEFLQVINVESFLPLAEYQAGVRACLEQIRAVPPAAGFDEVLIPGDRARRTYAHRMENGIPMPDVIWGQIQACADKLAVDLTQVNIK
ncbi:MAG: Ldh family oxidoreductase [Chloroflexota bacterium]